MASSAGRPGASTRIGGGGLALLLGAWVAGPVSADEWSITPRLDARLQYDDNYRLVVSDPVSTVGTIVDLAADLAWRTEVSRASISPRVRVNRFDQQQDLLNTDDLYLDLAAETSTERARYGLRGGIESATVLTSETIQDQEGLSLGRREVQADRDAWRLRPSWSYVLTERDRLSLDADLSAVDYESVPGGGYVDYRFAVANAALGHALTERDTVSGIVYLSRYDRDVLDSVTDSIGFQVGYERELTETLTGYAAFGMVRSEFTSDPLRFFVIGPGGVPLVGPDGRPVVIEVSNDSTDWGQLINLRLKQRLYEGEWSLEATRNLSPTGDGVLVTRDEVRADYTHRWTERLSGRLGVFAFKDESSTSRVQVADRDYARLELGVSYRLTPYWTVSGRYAYRYEKYDTVDDPADSNAVWVTLAWQGDRWAASR